jgi:hypothetical protein
VLGSPTPIRDSRADIVTINDTGTGTFLPEENCPLIMTNANVILIIGAKAYLERIYISFSGNYTIYNPTESMNSTLIAPFSSEFEILESSCEIKIENTTVPYEFLEYNYEDSPWEEYFDWEYVRTWSRLFLIVNATFPENDSITIEYSFIAYIDIMDRSFDYLNIYYDVGTSRAWNGTISERVEFKVYGKTPDSYSSSRNCTISDITNGKSYAWEWEDEIINSNIVYITYSYYNPYAKLIFFILFPSFWAVIIISLALIARRYKRKTRRELRPSN